VSAGQFLGFVVHERGIEVGQKSMKAIDEQFLQLIKPNCNLCLVKSTSSEGLFQIYQKGFYHFLLF
jgi:hypothetical protein